MPARNTIDFQAKDDRWFLNYINDNSFLQEATKVVYLNRIKKLNTIFRVPIKVWLNQPDVYGPILKALHEEGKFTDYAYKNNLTAVLALMSYSHFKEQRTDTYNRWYFFFNMIKKRIFVQTINHLPSQKQIDATINWLDLIKKRDSMQDKSGQDYVLMCLITMIPPRRQEDWFNVKIYNNPDDSWKPKDFHHNYINIGFKDPYILLSHYKTSHAFGRWYKKIPDDLLHVLQAFCQKYDRDVLFVSRTGQPYSSSSNFSKWSNKVIQTVSEVPSATMNSVRHSFVNYIHNARPNMSHKQRLDISKDMGHSIIQNIDYRHDNHDNILMQ